MLDLAKEAFDQIAVLVDYGIEAAPFGGCGSAWHDGFCAASGNSIHRPLPVIAFVGENMPCLQPVKQQLDLRDVVALPARQDEANGVAQRVGGGMNFGAQATF